MKETMYEITYLQTQLLALDMLKAKVSAELGKIYEVADLKEVQRIINDDKLMSTEYVFNESDQCEAIFEVTGKSMTFEELRNEVIGEMNE